MSRVLDYLRMAGGANCYKDARSAGTDEKETLFFYLLNSSSCGLSIHSGLMPQPTDGIKASFFKERPSRITEAKKES